MERGRKRQEVGRRRKEREKGATGDFWILDPIYEHQLGEKENTRFLILYLTRAKPVTAPATPIWSYHITTITSSLCLTDIMLEHEYHSQIAISRVIRSNISSQDKTWLILKYVPHQCTLMDIRPVLTIGPDLIYSLSCINNTTTYMYEVHSFYTSALMTGCTAYFTSSNKMPRPLSIRQITTMQMREKQCSYLLTSSLMKRNPRKTLMRNLD